MQDVSGFFFPVSYYFDYYFVWHTDNWHASDESLFDAAFIGTIGFNHPDPSIFDFQSIVIIDHKDPILIQWQFSDDHIVLIDNGFPSGIFGINSDADEAAHKDDSTHQEQVHHSEILPDALDQEKTP